MRLVRWFVWLCLIAACAPEQAQMPVTPVVPLTTEPQHADWPVYRAGPFNVPLPSTWEVFSFTNPLLGTIAQEDGLMLIGQAPQTDTQETALDQPPSLKQILLVREEVPLVRSLDKYIELSKHNLEQAPDVLGEVMLRWVKLPIGRAAEMRYRSRTFDTAGVMQRLEVTQYVLLREGVAYVLSGNATPDGNSEVQEVLLGAATGLAFR